MTGRAMTIRNSGKSITLCDFFRAFGYSDDDPVFFRMFEDSERKKNTPEGLWWNSAQQRTCGHNISCNLSLLPSILPTLDIYNKDNTAGVFFVVNGGGNRDVDVLNKGVARAQFFEIDHLSFEEQQKIIESLAVIPSVIVRTAKSYHCYFLLKDGKAARFRAVQNCLAEYTGGDPSVKNESRVMRVPSFYHNKGEKILVELQFFRPDLRYTQDELLEAFRASKSSFKTGKEYKRTTSLSESDSAVREPNRHNTFYLLACRCIDIGLSREAIIKALQLDNSRRCKPPLPESEIVNIIDCAYKYRKGEAGRTAYRKQKRAEVIASYED